MLIRSCPIDRTKFENPRLRSVRFPRKAKIDATPIFIDEIDFTRSYFKAEIVQINVVYSLSFYIMLFGNKGVQKERTFFPIFPVFFFLLLEALTNFGVKI